MVKQYRNALDRVTLEIPAGARDSVTEDTAICAKRELEEETGLLAEEWIDLGEFYPAAAYCDEVITMYLAKGLHQGTRHLDEDEFLNIVEVSLEELVEEVMQGKIADGKTQAAIMKVAWMMK